MAQTPEINENFIREVDDELRRDQALDLWRRYGRLAIGLLVAGLVALAGWLYWQNRREAAAGTQGERLAQAINSLESGNPAAARPELEALAGADAKGTQASAKLALAAAALDAGDAEQAARRYGEVAGDTRLDQPFRDVALIRQVAAQYDSLPPRQVVQRLGGLAVPGNPWFGSAGEMVGIAYLRMNQPKPAGEIFAALARDAGVPATIRSRAVQLASLVGVDTSTPAVRATK